ncbi:unnamed protein product [Blepharisma stoltei]|uniref:Kelch motif family protein n=1 Tax=Blepharisma stoltei TaxID=1481888 RepID=A0AAU9ITM1_9CILI|nr:unnamed protein product [Blepharisma stoltei]
MCEFIIERIKFPIFQKDYYTPFEYLLITNDDIQRDFIDEIKPPRIEKVEWRKDQCKKVNFYSSTFCHLLNNYNSYFINLGETNRDLKLAHLSYNKYKLDSPLFEFHSRIMLISPYEVLMTGGFESPKRCRIINLNTQTISEQADLTFGRFWHCCAFIMGYPGVIGGKIGDNRIKKVEIFKHNKWKKISSLNQNRITPVASSLFDKVYVFGGGNNKSIEIFNEDDKKWHELKCDIFETPTVGLGMISLSDDLLLVFGGMENIVHYFDDTYKINLTTREATSIEKLKKEGRFPYNSHIVRGKFLESFMFDADEEVAVKYEAKQEICLFN